MEKTVCELFAGVGGFRLGLEKSSNEWKTVWFSQWEPGKMNQWAHSCYMQHWNDIDDKNTNINIGDINKKEIPTHNLLVGGFPCQDYSVARTLSGNKGIKGKKGVLWWEIKKILIAKQTPFVLLENVDRLLKSPASQRGRDFAVMLACFAQMGYSVEWRIVNAADYGQAQRRRRVFIFAYKNTTIYARKLKKYVVPNIVSRDGFFAKTFPIERDLAFKEVQINYRELNEISDTFKFEFENAGYMNKGNVCTARVEPLYETSINIEKLLEKNVLEKYYVEKKDLERWIFLKGSKKIERINKDGYRYFFAEGGIPFPDPINKPARTMLTSETSLNRSTHVIEDPETKRLRVLTPVEAERIQGFEDNWTNTGMPEKMRYFVMGNALVTPLVTRMAGTLKEIFENEK